MNANELADELDYCYGKEYPCPASKEAATMLRQQQAEIEALKAHPVKELTDEEILHQNLIWGQQNGEDYSMLTVEDIAPLISLVRAILRKASEK